MAVPVDSLTERIDQFLEKRPPTPCVVIDVDAPWANFVQGRVFDGASLP